MAHHPGVLSNAPTTRRADTTSGGETSDLMVVSEVFCFLLGSCEIVASLRGYGTETLGPPPNMG